MLFKGLGYLIFSIEGINIEKSIKMLIIGPNKKYKSKNELSRVTTPRSNNSS